MFRQQNTGTDMVKRNFAVIVSSSDDLRVLDIHRSLSEISVKHNVVCDNVVMPSLTTMNGTLSGNESDIEKVVAATKLLFLNITFVLSESQN